MNRKHLISKYHVAVSERNALEEDTLTAEETAGYWLYQAPHNPLGEFLNMLKDNGIDEPNENSFYAKVREYLKIFS